MLTIQRLDHADAQILIEGAKEKASEIGVPMCIAVVDESGFLIAFQRMDGGKPLSTTLAQDKAHTAAISRKSTQAYNECCVPGSLTFGIHISAGGRFSTVGGGIPVEVDGVLVGAIGLSGGAPEQDIACAQAGINRFLAERA
ncbi:heme-binding protein [Magnetovibrio sp.]|uniref:GlcG/HbpS family heme-binding protein n=1 Tax=Magnetovibrio sp. TaxID=2024836 RepID=UPI002F922117